MEKYELKPGEIIILREENCEYIKSDGDTPSGELMLTSKSIVFTKREGFPAVITGYEAFPIKDIQLYNGNPQVKCGKLLYINLLEIYMNSGEVLQFGIGLFKKKAVTLKWVDAIYELITGNSFTENDKSLRSRLINMASKLDNKEQVVKTCKSCGAPIKGIKGQFTQCEYCGSGMKL